MKIWDKYFTSSEPNAQVTFNDSDKREILSFEMFKPKIKPGKMTFNIKSLSDSAKDKITGLKGMNMKSISMFIDNASSLPPCNLSDAYLSKTSLGEVDLSGADLSDVNLSNADLSYANLSKANLTWVNLTNAKLFKANLTDAILNVNATLATMDDANLSGASLNGASLDGVTRNGTTCPNGETNSGTSACTAKQLLLN